jgi:hypothetical protein
MFFSTSLVSDTTAATYPTAKSPLLSHLWRHHYTPMLDLFLHLYHLRSYRKGRARQMDTCHFHHLSLLEFTVELGD